MPLLAAGAGSMLPSIASSQSSAASRSSVIETYLTPRVFEVPIQGGKVVRAYEVGPPDVPVVVGIHGTPGTGLGHITSYVASGPIFCRLVTLDRQGYGGTTPEPGRKIRDIVPLVKAVLDHLSVERASIFGSSGGGPLALATAALLPGRVSRVASLAGVGPNYGPGGFDYVNGSTPIMKEEIEAARKGSEASREFWRRSTPYEIDAAAKAAIDDQLYAQNDQRVEKMLSPVADRLAKQLMLTSSKYSLEDAYVDDVQSWVSPWGFDLSSIKVPARFFHGLADLEVTPRHSIWLQTQIPGASVELFPHVGHNLAQLMPHYLAWLVSDFKTRSDAR